MAVATIPNPCGAAEAGTLRQIGIWRDCHRFWDAIIPQSAIQRAGSLESEK
jgi:hypothetical protein